MILSLNMFKQSTILVCHNIVDYIHHVRECSNPGRRGAGVPY